MTTLNNLHKTNLIKLIKQRLPDFDEQALDFKAYWNKQLSHHENYANVLKQLSIPYTEPDLKGLESDFNKQMIEAEETNARQELDKAIQGIIEKTNPEVEKHYRTAKQLIKMIAEGHTNSLILESEGGLGKSHLILKTLTELKAEFVYRAGYITPLELYQDLYSNNGKIIVYDDVEGLFNDEKCISILKPMLWAVGGKRIVSYISSSNKLIIPNSFEFTGRLVFALNQLPEGNKSLQALINRTLHYCINFGFNDKIKLFYEIAKEPYKDLTLKERLKVVKFLAETCDETIKDLSIRTLLKGFDFYAFDDKEWATLLSALIEKDNSLALIKDLMKKHGLVSEQVKEWIETTGLGRRSFFYKKALLVQKARN